jgi:predicted DCC family thiol-disulfide oxidoreductase YuxK
MSTHRLLYDRDCGLCRTIVAAALALDRKHRLRPLAVQHAEAAHQLPNLSPEQRLGSFHLIDEATGEVASAGAGLAQLVAILPAGAHLGAVMRRVPRASERAYRLVAGNRDRIGRVIPKRVKSAATRRIDAAADAAGAQRRGEL